MKKLNLFPLLLIIALYGCDSNLTYAELFSSKTANKTDSIPNEEIVHKTKAVVIDKFIGYETYYKGRGEYQYVSVYRFINGVFFEQKDIKLYYSFSIGDTVNVDFKDQISSITNKVSGFNIVNIYK